MHNIRSTGSYIRGTNGTSNGIVPMLRVFNDTGAPPGGCWVCLVASKDMLGAKPPCGGCMKG